MEHDVVGSEIVESIAATYKEDRPLSWWWVALIALLTVGVSAVGVYEGYRYGEAHPDTPAITITIPELPSENVSPLDAFNSKPASKPADAPPVDKVRIGPYDYTIQYRTEDEMPGYYGLTSKPHNTILLRNDIPSGELRETLLHELFHACAESNNLLHGQSTYDNDPDNDDYIERVAPWLLQVIQQNPELVAWLDHRQ